MAKSDKKGIYKTSENTVIDSETGEVIENTQQIEKVFFDKEPDFIKLYVSDIVRLKSLPPATEKLLLVIVKHMGYKNIFQAYKPIKTIMCKELKISLNTLNKSITQLKNAGILIPMKEYGKGLYLVDPNLFARGKWEDIKNLRLVIEYDNKTGQRKLSSNLPEKLQLELGL